MRQHPVDAKACQAKRLGDLCLRQVTDISKPGGAYEQPFLAIGRDGTRYGLAAIAFLSRWFLHQIILSTPRQRVQSGSAEPCAH
ncbi:hypothetical protein NKH28_29810 [Mesorhizobium sp. M1227]|uniref:hypothetical protein n=1 Tax=Mesorhizobium sp. M1227 TaxID=2957071 RepID=UPI0033395BA3